MLGVAQFVTIFIIRTLNLWKITLLLHPELKIFDNVGNVTSASIHSKFEKYSAKHIIGNISV